MGTSLTHGQFLEWLAAREDFTTKSKTNVYQARKSLVGSTTHPKMRGMGLEPYNIVSTGKKELSVVSIETDLALHAIKQNINTLAECQRRRIATTYGGLNKAGMSPEKTTMFAMFWEHFNSKLNSIKNESLWISRSHKHLSDYLFPNGTPASSVPTID